MQDDSALRDDSEATLLSTYDSTLQLMTPLLSAFEAEEGDECVCCRWTQHAQRVIAGSNTSRELQARNTCTELQMENHVNGLIFIGL